MKYITFVIPCYNSQDYMAHAIESALIGGEDVEILIINDGSSDDTQKIAEEYQAKYPSIVRAIEQKNGGHGAAVNTGIQRASGKYLKVIDSDDWLDESALKRVLQVLHDLESRQESVDMLITNYVYEKVGAKHKKVVRYANALPRDCIFTWDDVRHFRMDQYLLMHSLIYRTAVLRESRLYMPRHTFYVDNIFVYVPLPYVHKMYYLDVDLYRYFIGRDDQSINEQTMIKRIDQQYLVARTIIDSYQTSEIKNRKLRIYMQKHELILMLISSIIAIRSHDPKNLEMKEELWEYLKRKDPKTYRKLRYCTLGVAINLPGKAGRKFAEKGYEIVRDFFGFQ